MKSLINNNAYKYYKKIQLMLKIEILVISLSIYIIMVTLAFILIILNVLYLSNNIRKRKELNK